MDSDDDAAEEEEEDVREAKPLPIRENALRDVLAAGFAADTKLQPAALTLSSVLIRQFVEEACHRAEAEATDDGETEITDEHLEKILPQLLLDFGP